MLLSSKASKRAETAYVMSEADKSEWKPVTRKNVFQYMHMDHAQVSKVISDKRISSVAFTGSVAGGRAVQKASAEEGGK